MSWHLVGVANFERALALTVAQTEEATRRAVAQGGHLIERETKQQLSRYSHRKGKKTPSPAGEPPAVVTGTLRRSITTTRPLRRGFGSYEVQVGPTVVYARIQELGGTTGRKGTRGYNWGQQNTVLLARPYLAPGFKAAVPQLRELYRAAWARALR